MSEQQPSPPASTAPTPTPTPTETPTILTATPPITSAPTTNDTILAPAFTDPTPAPAPEPTPAVPTPPPATRAPESYTFTAPDGAPAIDQTLLDEATPIFKELDLPQADAEKLVALWNKTNTLTAERIRAAAADLSKQWETQLKADPILGPKLDTVRADIGRAFATLSQTPEGAATVNNFREAMNFTGLGNHPAMVSMINLLISSVLREGTHVAGAKPSTAGQTITGTPAGRPSIANALFPNLPSSSS